MATRGWRPGGAWVVATLVVAAVAGCAAPREGATRAQPASPPASTIPAFSDPLRGATTRSVPPAPVAPTTPPATVAGERLRSIPWTLVAVPDRGRRVVVRYNVVGCTRLGRVALRESDRSVELGVVIADLRGGGRVCPAYTTSELAAIQLARPLDSRTLVHAPSEP